MVVDTAITVLREHGFDLSEPGLHSRTMTREEEVGIETAITNRTLEIVAGHGECESYFDRFIDGRTELSGTTYEMKRGRLQRHDFSLVTTTKRTADGCLGKPNQFYSMF